MNHVSEQSINIAKICIPNLYAVTDSIGAAGLKDGNYKFANVEIIKKEEKITLINSSTLAGSVVDMHKTFLNLLKIKKSINEAVAMTSYNASKYLKLKNVGMINLEYKANFLVLNVDYNIKAVYLNGKKIER